VNTFIAGRLFFDPKQTVFQSTGNGRIELVPGQIQQLTSPCDFVVQVHTFPLPVQTEDRKNHVS